MTPTSTADLCDADPTATPLRLSLRSHGGGTHIDGPVATAHVDGSNQLLKEILAGPGGGRVLLVDGGGAAAWFTLVGDTMAQVAIDNGWQGIVVDGLVRDASALATMPTGSSWCPPERLRRAARHDRSCTPGWRSGSSS